MKTPHLVSQADLRVMDLMVEVGADLSAATEVNHYLYLPTGAAAERAAAHLRKRGFVAEARPPMRGFSGWGLLASHTAVVSGSTIGLLRASMERLAAEFGWKYDGWEAVVSPGGDRS